MPAPTGARKGNGAIFSRKPGEASTPLSSLYDLSGQEMFSLELEGIRSASGTHIFSCQSANKSACLGCSVLAAHWLDG